MFGQANQTTVGSTTTQNPSMLDNVSAQDFQVTDDNSTDQKYQDPATDNSASSGKPDPVANTQPLVFATTPADDQQTTVEHPITTDNPFVQDPIDPITYGAPTTPTPATTQPADDTSITATDDDSQYLPAVDHAKLADLKQQALEHLEPLADHLDGTPEETFKTTMMMIQANDNHTLLEKALEAARKIEDDKVRAQAMLDIINEINYFSQQQ